ncbi:APC family permease [Halovivax sp.]|uniref:APC family permease n=1 Tax=Halovivax sp. TaxID=1935978 RepID=UPI0025C73407|nr:APC family permease [Halovivax sp.]
MSGDEYKLITDRVGLVGGIALLMGTAIGMSIFLVPTQMMQEAGPSITVAILLSIFPMVFGILLLLQLGGAIPVAGGNYVYGSRLVGPFWGLLAVAIPVIAVWSYLLFAALGFAEFLPVLLDALGVSLSTPGALDGLPIDLGALAAVWGLLAFFLAINYRGIQLVTKVQIALVVLFCAGMLTFVVGGFLSFDADNFTPLFPDGEGQPFADGLAPFFLAAVVLYIPFQGFAMIIEIGEELDDPVKNIPRVLAVGMSLVAVLTIAVVFALVGAVPWEEVTDAAVEGGIAGVADAHGILPTFGVGLVALAALIAAATTVNTLLTSYSRTIMRASRDNVVPDYFAAIHGEHGTPHRSIALLGLVPIALAPFFVSIDTIGAVDVLDWLVTLTVTGIFIAFMIAGVALWNLPKVFPQRYEFSFYRLPMPVLKVVAVGNVVISFIFTLLVAASAPTALVAMFVWLLVAAGMYVYRVRRYAKRGVDLKAEMSLLHKHEKLGGSNTDGGD